MKDVLELRNIVEKANYKFKNKELNFIVEKFIALAKQHYGNDIIDYKGAFKFKQDKVDCLNSCERIVIGGHGPYVEFSLDNALFSVEMPYSEQYRLNPKYNNIKYLYYNPKDREEKIYKQKRTVKYADYRVNFYYIDLYSLCRSEF